MLKENEIKNTYSFNMELNQLALL